MLPVRLRATTPRRPAGRSLVFRLLLPSLLLLLAVPLVTSVCRADLRFEGDAPHEELIRSLYRRLPAFLRTDEPVVVREVSDDEMSRLVDDDDSSKAQGGGSYGEVQAFYDGPMESEDGFSTITIRDSMSDRLTSLVFTHEYGHFVWDERLDRRDRRDYVTIWNRQKKAHRLVSAYAADSVEEGFAEAFAHYFRTPDALKKRDRASWQFVDDFIHRADGE